MNAKVFGKFVCSLSLYCTFDSGVGRADCHLQPGMRTACSRSTQATLTSRKQQPARRVTVCPGHYAVGFFKPARSNTDTLMLSSSTSMSSVAPPGISPTPA